MACDPSLLIFSPEAGPARSRGFWQNNPLEGGVCQSQVPITGSQRFPLLAGSIFGKSSFLVSNNHLQQDRRRGHRTSRLVDWRNALRLGLSAEKINFVLFFHIFVQFGETFRLFQPISVKFLCIHIVYFVTERLNAINECLVFGHL